jgi:hypothetical protein
MSNASTMKFNMTLVTILLKSLLDRATTHQYFILVKDKVMGALLGIS